MICNKCSGKGYYFSCAPDGMYDVQCEVCKGKGNLNKNGKPIIDNFERITKSPEALASWVCEFVDFCNTCCSECPICDLCQHKDVNQKELLVEWLKQESKDGN